MSQSTARLLVKGALAALLIVIIGVGYLTGKLDGTTSLLVGVAVLLAVDFEL